MANVNAPLGFQFRGSLSGNPSGVQTVLCYHPSSDNVGLFIGDLVKSPSTHATDSTTGLPVVTQAATTDAPFGVVIGVNPIQGVAIGSDNLNRVYCPASTAMYINVCTDPDAIYEIQSAGTVLTTDILKYAAVASTPVGSTTYGTSGMQLDEATVSTSPTNTNMFILSQIQTPDNAIDAANSRLLVKLANLIQRV